MRTPYDRLHFLSAASTVPTFLIVAAVAVEAGLRADAVKAVLTGLILLVIGPVLTHAMARAIRIQEHGGLDVTRERR
jgi:multicomponent Na+:H+ antiporter subunit G